MAHIAPNQLAHLKANQALFDEHQQEEGADIEAYFREHDEDEPGDLYSNLCHDLDLEPAPATALRPSSRGFMQGDEIPSAYGGHIRAYESSAAMHPHVWVRTESPVDLNDREGPMKEAVAHLRIEDAVRLRDQLTALIDGHYQLQDED